MSWKKITEADVVAIRHSTEQQIMFRHGWYPNQGKTYGPMWMLTGPLNVYERVEVMAETSAEGWIDLTPKQRKKLIRALSNVDDDSAVVTVQLLPQGIVVTCTQTQQQWRIGPRGGWF